MPVIIRRKSEVPKAVEATVLIPALVEGLSSKTELSLEASNTTLVSPITTSNTIDVSKAIKEVGIVNTVLPEPVVTLDKVLPRVYTDFGTQKPLRIQGGSTEYIVKNDLDTIDHHAEALSKPPPKSPTNSTPVVSDYHTRDRTHSRLGIRIKTPPKADAPRGRSTGNPNRHDGRYYGRVSDMPKEAKNQHDDWLDSFNNIKCLDCRDTKKVVVYDVCDYCLGKGCKKCNNTGDVKNYIPCQACSPSNFRYK